MKLTLTQFMKLSDALKAGHQVHSLVNEVVTELRANKHNTAADELLALQLEISDVLRHVDQFIDKHDES